MPAPVPAPDPRRADAWLLFVRRSGAEGRRWAEGYARFEGIAAMNGECLALLHARRWEEGDAALRRFRAAVDAAGADPATRDVLERWYEAVDGYRLYCLGAFAEADAAMRRASDAVARAVGRVGALLPLVTHCHEFRLHRARIARNRRCWAEMWAHVDEVRGMFEGCRPFCRLPGGGEVGMAEVERFHRGLRGLDADERAAADHLLDAGERMRDFDRFVRRMTRIPGFVIPLA